MIRARTLPTEIARGVYRVPVWGSNAYLVESGSSWALIDPGWAHQARVIWQAADAVFGHDASPAAILLTHDHPDHSGSGLEMTRHWGLPLYMHPAELPMSDGVYHPEYANPLDQRIIEPLLRIFPAWASRMMARSALGDAARAFDPGAPLPGLEEWTAVPTPGHTPGHVAFFRPRDRVLIAGDAVLTIDLGSVWDVVRGKQRLAGPPRVSTWRWEEAVVSVARLAALEPDTLACGHGAPMTGPGTARALRAFADTVASAPRRQPPVPATSFRTR